MEKYYLSLITNKMSLNQIALSARKSVIGLACLAVIGCSTTAPVELTQKDLQAINSQDAANMRKNVEPISEPLSLNEALARALKYNLDRRSKMMEEALALGQLEVGKFDMLPKLMAQAGYSYRDKPRFTGSTSYDQWVASGIPSSFPATRTSTTSEPTHYTAELGMTWSLLDFGMGYYGSKQNETRLQIASEKRRKAMHLLMQDVRNAYWRAASAQQLKEDVKKTIALAEEALSDSHKLANERVKNPLDPLRYQRQLLENLRLLENINQELSIAQVELAALINAPLNEPIQIADTDLINSDTNIEDISLESLESVALVGNADLREQHYNSRIAQQETRRVMTRMFPNLVFNYGAKYDTDNYLLNRNWNEAGLQLSFNLMNIFTGSSQMKLADAGVALADQRRMAMQMTVLTQLHLARLSVINSRSQFDRADAIFSTDKKISAVMSARQSVQAQSKLDLVSTKASEILSLLRRYQALAQVQVAENRLVATLGMDPEISSVSEVSLKDLTAQLAKAQSPWKRLSDTPPSDSSVKVRPSTPTW